jgi:hypothetical protein
MARTRESRRRPPAHAARVPKQPRSAYLITGLVLGGLWLLNRDKSLLYHAAQMTSLMSVLTVTQIVLGQIVLRRRGGAPASPGAYARLFGRLLGPKLALVAVGVGAEWLLAPMTPRSNAIVAAGLAVLVTALGPVVDRGATSQATPATGSDQVSLAPGGVPPGPPFTGRETP